MNVQHKTFIKLTKIFHFSILNCLSDFGNSNEPTRRDEDLN